MIYYNMEHLKVGKNKLSIMLTEIIYVCTQTAVSRKMLFSTKFSSERSSLILEHHFISFIIHTMCIVTHLAYEQIEIIQLVQHTKQKWKFNNITKEYYVQKAMHWYIVFHQNTKIRRWYKFVITYISFINKF